MKLRSYLLLTEVLSDFVPSMFWISRTSASEHRHLCVVPDDRFADSVTRILTMPPTAFLKPMKDPSSGHCIQSSVFKIFAKEMTSLILFAPIKSASQKLAP